MTSAERKHVEKVKCLPCSVCDLHGPSDAHHIEQGQHFTVVALCKDCHQGLHNGWHGRKAMWAVREMNEMDALNITLKRIYE